EAARLRGLEIDHQLELGRLLDWQLRWLCSFQNPNHIESATPPQLGDAGAIRHESVELRVFPGRKSRRQSVLCDQLDDPAALRKQHRTRNTNTACARSAMILANALSISSGLRAAARCGCRFSAFAACVTSATRLRIVASPKAPGCQRTPTRESSGSPSLSRAKRLGTSSGPRKVVPVMFPPGRAMLATSPSCTGSPMAVTTIGIVVVARCV